MTALRKRLQEANPPEPVMQQVDKELKLPTSPHANKKDPAMAKHEVAVNLRLSPDGNKKGILIMDDKTYTNWEDLIPNLKAMAEKDNLLRVVVRGDAKMPAGEIQRVMNLIGEAGVADIAFAASNK